MTGIDTALERARFGGHPPAVQAIYLAEIDRLNAVIVELSGLPPDEMDLFWQNYGESHR